MIGRPLGRVSKRTFTSNNLHKTQRIYECEIQRMQETMDNSHDFRELNKASKRKEKLQKQLEETKDYNTMLAHISRSRIDIDLTIA